MMAVLILVVLIHLITYTNGNCFTDIVCVEKLNLNNMAKNCPILDWSEFYRCVNISELIISSNNITQIEGYHKTNLKRLSHLDLSFNKLKHLPKGFLFQAKELTKLNLMNNYLLDLPEDFFNASTKLQILHLEGNPISSVPSTIIKTNLVNLTVDCRCDVTKSVVGLFSRSCQSATFNECKKGSFYCKSTNEWLDINIFYTENCYSSRLLAAYIFIPLVIVGIIAVVVLIVVVRKKRKLSTFEAKSDLNASPAQAQPRYTSRNLEYLPKEGSSNSKAPGKAYENVFIGQLHPPPTGQYECLDRSQQDTRSHSVEEDYYMQCDTNEGNHPIYGNTEQMYYNYSGPQNQPDDDVYILPDT
ncbi:leucine-rich repeat-containing protein 25 isoform X2 [Lissotriton helveticus]